MKFCKDCKFYEADFLYNEPVFSKCLRNEAKKQKDSVLHMVSGEAQKIKYKFCTDMRAEEDSCGKEAKLFGAKP